MSSEPGAAQIDGFESPLGVELLATLDWLVQKDGGTVEYQVEHPKWRCFPVEEIVFDCDVAALYGAELASTLREKPGSAFLADGSPIVVRRGVRLID